eukprot:scaffold22642_cov134-Cylindrotheca_fusiformis.AAC.20
MLCRVAVRDNLAFARRTIQIPRLIWSEKCSHNSARRPRVGRVLRDMDRGTCNNQHGFGGDRSARMADV